MAIWKRQGGGMNDSRAAACLFFRHTCGKIHAKKRLSRAGRYVWSIVRERSAVLHLWDTLRLLDMSFCLLC